MTLASAGWLCYGLPVLAWNIAPPKMITPPAMRLPQ